MVKTNSKTCNHLFCLVTLTIIEFIEFTELRVQLYKSKHSLNNIWWLNYYGIINNFGHHYHLYTNWDIPHFWGFIEYHLILIYEKQEYRP